MARRRMFSLDVVDTDAFLDLPSSAQALYFHLGMRADDDGFVSAPRKIVRSTNCGADDLKLLVSKGLVIPFDSGVCVITDWYRNNYIQNDRHHQTIYHAEYELLTLENRRYALADTACIQTVSIPEAESRFSLEKYSSRRTASFRDASSTDLQPLPTLDDVLTYADEIDLGPDEARKFFDFNQARGWFINGTPIADWRALERRWKDKARPIQAESTAPTETRDVDGEGKSFWLVD